MDAFIRDLDRRQTESYNSSKGSLDDGYDCPKCLNRGDFMVLREGMAPAMQDCECKEIRKRLRRIKASGLEKSIKEQTFETFRTEEPWQKAMFDKAKQYAGEGVSEGRWFYIGGQVGCGKTHICTAIAGKLINEMPVCYEVWPQTANRLKALKMDAEGYEYEIGKLQRAEVLYLDDFFKPMTGHDGYKTMPTVADMQLAFEILNYRYINRMPTIISSEWRLDNLGEMDEAIWSRIVERCGPYITTLERNRDRNQRQRKG